MKKLILQIFLYPFSMLYGLITGARNLLFDKNILTSTPFDIPIISVGNLSVGGTGKTPHTEFILALLQDNNKIALLSRGYKRQTKGFFLADENADALKLGDEPFQIYQKFPKVTVAVDEKRVHGVQILQELVPNLGAIVLDDAYQHRYIVPGLSILLTDYNHLYSRDLVLPAGRLREWKCGSKRANIIVVTKCPDDLAAAQMQQIIQELKPRFGQELYFSKYVYQEISPVFPAFEIQKWTHASIKQNNAAVLLVAAIVYPQSIVEHLHNYTSKVETLFYRDHHSFLIEDLMRIMKTFDGNTSPNKIIIVTEKDAARLVTNQFFPDKLKALIYALPINVRILNNQEDLFKLRINDYVEKNSRNS